MKQRDHPATEIFQMQPCCSHSIQNEVQAEG